MAEKIMIVVESPAKTKTISKYVGKQYIVKSSMGHVRDLNPNILSIDVENNYQPHYEELKKKKDIIDDLKKTAKKVDKILLAPDPDREGEAIAFHLSELLKKSNPNTMRILFNEITKPAILKSIENPSQINMDKVDSQQMRRLLDRLAGYKISPILQRKMGGPLSAGRVQSVALKLIVEREREIQKFEPEEYWNISVDLKGSTPPVFNAKLEKSEQKKISVKNEEQSDTILSDLKQNEFLLKTKKVKVKKKKPLPPLITSTLQQEAFKRFKYPVKRTMRIAQELYEGVVLQDGESTGLITYMRTDSFRISAEGQNAARDYIISAFGPEYLPDKPFLFGKKGKVQDAHESIRPTLPLRNPEEVESFLNDTQLKIYRLIWERFLASQMKEAVIEETVFEILNGKYLFLSKGEVLKFQGHLMVYKSHQSINELPPLAEGEILDPEKIESKQNFTTPPPRYTEATLVKILEEKGIGRPSTYASIIDVLGKREYVHSEDRKFVPTFLGFRVVEYLENHFKDIMNYNFTAELEKDLDKVSEGQLNWVEGIDRFYQKLRNDLEVVKDSPKVELIVEKKCPECKNDLIQKYSAKTRGWFIGCKGYPECKYTERIEELSGEKKKDEKLDRKCPTCGEDLIKRYSPKTRSYFVGCSGYPKCKYIEAHKEEMGDCPMCEKKLLKRFSRKTRRFFVGCSGYPECKYIEKKSR